MPKYDISFTSNDGHGNVSKSPRIIVEAANSDEAMDKAYNMRWKYPQYDNVWVSERKEGLTSYICEIYLDLYWNGKLDGRGWPEYHRFEATSETDAKRQARNKFIGKYFKGSQYHKDDTLLDSPTSIGQSMRFAKIVDCYQV